MTKANLEFERVFVTVVDDVRELEAYTLNLDGRVETKRIAKLEDGREIVIVKVSKVFKDSTTMGKIEISDKFGTIEIEARIR